MDADKLEKMFKVKYATLVVEGNPDATYENWVGYCDKYKIFLLHPEWLRDTLNEDGLRGRICVHTPEPDFDPPPWLLVPRKFAQRALILGYLP